MRPIAYCQIFHLPNNFTNPERASRLMRDYMEKVINLNKNTMVKDTILKFNKSRVADSVVIKLKNSYKS